MNCEHVTLRLPDYLAEALHEDERREFQAHVESCAACQKEVESVSAIWMSLGKLPQEQPSAALPATFQLMLEAYKQGMVQAPAAPRWRTAIDGWLERWWPRQPAIQFALALLFMVMGGFIGSRFTTKEPQNNEISQLKQEVQNMRQIVTLSLLNQPSPSERLRGVSWSAAVDQPDQEIMSALMNTLNFDPNVNVRLAAVDALYLYSSDPVVRDGLVKAISQQSSPLVQIALIDLIVEMREKQALRSLQELIKQEKINQEVRQRAEWGIKQLS